MRQKMNIPSERRRIWMNRNGFAYDTRYWSGWAGGNGRKEGVAGQMEEGLEGAGGGS
ncbi:hypothetical protein BDQ17DRAFT_1383611 [Cyathus striatus]|nr:hypothetical protein BDQ17DRAFT_1383611 [Cyathus striatus]